MFLNGHTWYGRDGEQCSQGSFLILATKQRPPGDLGPLKPEIRALVRFTTMRQLGHFMMATVKVGEDYKISLSGAYGADGLPREVPVDLWDLLHEVPADLQEAFWAGGGHNSTGTEAEAFRQWALAHRHILCRLKPRLYTLRRMSNDSPDNIFALPEVRRGTLQALQKWCDKQFPFIPQKSWLFGGYWRDGETALLIT